MSPNTGHRATTNMAAPTVDLLDDEVEKLLRDAELRLALKQAPPEKSLIKPQDHSTALTTVPSTADKTQAADKKAKQSSAGLTVRTPELDAKKNKVCCTRLRVCLEKPCHISLL